MSKSIPFMYPRQAVLVYIRWVNSGVKGVVFLVFVDVDFPGVLKLLGLPACLGTYLLN